MKSTGIVRRIDELGRIVIPKELRKSLHIREGEALEIFVDEEKIVLQKQMILYNALNISQELLSIIDDIYDFDILICDREKVICSSKKQSKLTNLNLSNKVLKLMEDRESYIASEREKICFSNEQIESYIGIFPIITDADVTGVIIILKDSIINNEDMKVVKLIRKIIVSRLSIS